MTDVTVGGAQSLDRVEVYLPYTRFHGKQGVLMKEYIDEEVGAGLERVIFDDGDTAYFTDTELIVVERWSEETPHWPPAGA